MGYTRRAKTPVPKGTQGVVQAPVGADGDAVVTLEDFRKAYERCREKYSEALELLIDDDGWEEKLLSEAEPSWLLEVAKKNREEFNRRTPEQRESALNEINQRRESEPEVFKGRKVVDVPDWVQRSISEQAKKRRAEFKARYVKGDSNEVE